MLKRHEIQVLRRAGHSQEETSRLAGVSVRSVRRVEDEAAVVHVDNGAERERRRIGRPSKAEPFRPFVVELLTTEPDLLSVEIVRRAKLAGYRGGKSALYELIHSIRPKHVRLLTRFEGLPGEFCQHDFGQVDVRFLDGTRRRVHFFASRLKYSRWTEVSLVEDEAVESLVRAMVDHFAAMGGIPLLSVFDRPKTIAVTSDRDGQVTQWNPTFAGVALDLGLGVELCWLPIGRSSVPLAASRERMGRSREVGSGRSIMEENRLPTLEEDDIVTVALDRRSFLAKIGLGVVFASGVMIPGCSKSDDCDDDPGRDRCSVDTDQQRL